MTHQLEACYELMQQTLRRTYIENGGALDSQCKLRCIKLSILETYDYTNDDLKRTSNQ
jgi:hypothetical protein